MQPILKGLQPGGHQILHKQSFPQLQCLHCEKIFASIWSDSPLFQCSTVTFCRLTVVLKYKLFPASSQRAFNIWSLWFLCPLLFQMKSPQVQISLQVTFPKFLIIPIPLLQILMKVAVSFLKSDSLMGSLPVYSWAAWSLPYLTRNLLSAQLPTAQPSHTQIWFWFSFPQLSGGRERDILPHSKSRFILVLSAPT